YEIKGCLRNGLSVAKNRSPVPFRPQAPAHRDVISSVTRDRGFLWAAKLERAGRVALKAGGFLSPKTTTEATGWLASQTLDLCLDPIPGKDTFSTGRTIWPRAYHIGASSTG